MPRRSRSRPSTSGSGARSSCRRAPRSARSRPVVAFGATVTEGGASLTEAVEAAEARAAATGWAFCHPFDDPVVVAGQGTLGLELLDDIDDLALVIVPIGGGGLASGLAIAIKSISPAVRIVGVQAAACAPYSGHAAPVGAGRDARRRDRRQVARCDHAAARRTLDRRDRHGRRGVDRRRDGAADGAGEALRRRRRGGRRGGAARRPRGAGARPAPHAPCSPAATSTSASSRA